MIKIKNKKADVLYRLNYIFGADLGILASGFTKLRIETNSPQMHILGVAMPDYTPFIYGKHVEIAYHICGYDWDILSALQRMMGEAVERYAGIVAYSLFKDDRFCLQFYNALQQQNFAVLKPQYLNVYSEEKYSKMHQKFATFASKPLDNFTKIEWFLCNSLLHGKVWLPLQFFFGGFNKWLSRTKSSEKIYYLPTSTGTAVHVDHYQALLNALIEAIQINNFNKNWFYGKTAHKIVIDDEAINTKIAKLIGGMDDEITVEFHLYEDSIFHIPTIGCYIFSKKNAYPAVSFGMQCGVDLKHTIIRALMEALAVYTFNFVSYTQKPDLSIVKHSSVAMDSFMDFDKNVVFYASNDNYEICKSEISKRSLGVIQYSAIKQLPEYAYGTDLLAAKQNLKILLQKFKKNNIDVFYQDITPLEVKDLYSAVCIKVPNFIPVCLPSAPFDNHPDFGSIVDDFIHPMA